MHTISTWHLSWDNATIRPYRFIIVCACHRRPALQWAGKIESVFHAHGRCGIQMHLQTHLPMHCCIGTNCRHLQICTSEAVCMQHMFEGSWFFQMQMAHPICPVEMQC